MVNSSTASGRAPHRARKGLDIRWGSKIPNLVLEKGALGFAALIILRTGLQHLDAQWVGRGLVWGGIAGSATGLLELNEFFAADNLKTRARRSRSVDQLLKSKTATLIAGLTYMGALAASVAVIWSLSLVGSTSRVRVGCVVGVVTGCWLAHHAVGYSLVALRSRDRVERLDNKRPPEHPLPMDLLSRKDLNKKLNPDPFHLDSSSTTSSSS